jgi:hypothetical protein
MSGKNSYCAGCYIARSCLFSFYGNFLQENFTSKDQIIQIWQALRKHLEESQKDIASLLKLNADISISTTAVEIQTEAIYEFLNSYLKTLKQGTIFILVT